ncbi:MAG: hypothetical protein KKD74_02445 [Bacteroidetes bacterium]|nr:hypothetical protein [Bacteroidota bacterium]
MKTKQYLSILTSFGLLSGLILLLNSCHQKDPLAFNEEYLIHVDSIAMPAQLVSGQTLSVAFYGMIGPDGCSAFSRFIVEQKPMGFRLKLVGKRRVGPEVVCPMNVPMLDGKTLDLMVSDTGKITVEVINPGIDQVLTGITEIVTP